MTSHNATRNAHDVMWKWIGWQRQRRTCYRVQYHNVKFMSAFLNYRAQQTSYIIILCTTKILLPRILEMYVSLACFDRDMIRSKYARRVRPWSFSMLCTWRHWRRGMYLLPLQRHTRETSLSTWLPMPALSKIYRTFHAQFRKWRWSEMLKSIVKPNYNKNNQLQ